VGHGAPKSWRADFRHGFSLEHGPLQWAGAGDVASGEWDLMDAEIGSTSNHPVSLFANNGAARVTLFPSGNFSIGNIRTRRRWR